LFFGSGSRGRSGNGCCSGGQNERKEEGHCNLLWGGALLLAFEHLWHGEVVPWFPFLTAASDPAETAVMLSEMSTVGVTMAVLVTAVWVGMLVVCNVLLKRARKQAGAAK